MSAKVQVYIGNWEKIYVTEIFYFKMRNYRILITKHALDRMSLDSLEHQDCVTLLLITSVVMV